MLADDPPGYLLVPERAKLAHRARGSDDDERVELLRERHLIDLFGKVACEAILLLLVKIGLIHRAAGKAGAGRGGRLARGVGLDVAVLAIFARPVRGGAQVDLAFVALIAQEQRLAAVGDEDEGVVGEGHGLAPSGGSNAWVEREVSLCLPRRDRRAVEQAVVAVVAAGRTVKDRAIVPHDQHVGLPRVRIAELLAPLPLDQFVKDRKSTRLNSSN